MWLFRKERRVRQKEAEPGIRDRLAVKLAALLVTVQTIFARKMNRLFANVSVSRMKRLLILFCGMTCLLSTYFIVKALKSGGDYNSIVVDQSKTPKFFNRTGELPSNDGIIIDEESFSKVQVFRQYMDSLKGSDSSMYHSILLQRPGLMDSIASLESLYYSQKIK